MSTRAPLPWRFALAAALASLMPACEDVSVTAVEVDSLSVAPAAATVAEGDTLRLAATLRDASGNTLPERPIEWSSEEPEVASVEENGLVRGLVPGTVRIRATSGAATDHSSITVVERPRIVLSEYELRFEAVTESASPETRDIDVSNGGEGTLGGLELSVTHPSGEADGWLEATLQETTAPTVLSVRADPSDLSPGTYRGQVEVAAPAADNSPEVIEVTFVVGEPPPRIEVQPESVTFEMAEGEEVPPARTVSVANIGSGELSDLEATISYADGEPTGWLAAELGGTTAPTELTLRVDPRGLASPAVLDAVVEVTSPAASGSPGRVAVRFRLGEPLPEIELDPEEIGWEIVENDPTPSGLEVAIDNRGGGGLGGLSASVVYGSGGRTGWLGVGLSSTDAPSVLSTNLTTTSLPPGAYEATVRVASPDATNSPRSVSVRVDVAPRAAPGTSTIAADRGSIAADGSSTSTITVHLRDSRGDALPSGGDDVALSTTLGFLSDVTDHDDGTYTATLTSSTTTGTATVTGTVNGDAIGDETTVEFTSPSASAATSTIEASPTSIEADGASTSTITVQLRDGDGNELTNGGDDVRLSTTAGILGDVDDRGDGTYTTTLTSSTTAETATITGTVNGAEIEDEAIVEFTAAGASAATSTIEASPTSIVADGASTSTITVRLRDADGNELTGGGDVVTLFTTAGVLGDVDDRDDGTYTTTLTSSTTAETATVTGTVNGAEIEDDAAVEFTAPAASAATSTIEASPTSIVADGASTSTVTVRLRDADGNELTSGGDTVDLSTTAGVLGDVDDRDDGTYTTTLTSSTTAETATITGTVNGAEIEDEAAVAFTAPAASAATSIIEASPTSIVADGASTSTVTVRLRDADGNELTSGGDTVDLSTTAGVLGDVDDRDDGTYTTTLTSSTTAETATITGTVNGAEIEDEATVEFTPDTASSAAAGIEGSPVAIVAVGAPTWAV